MLELRKKGNKHWLLIDDEIGKFTPSKFTINRLNSKIEVVYFNNLESKEYNVSDCYIFDIDDTSGFNTSDGVEFMDKLEELNCPCFQKDVNNFYISGGTWGSITGDIEEQTDLIEKFNEKMSSDISTYTPATTPLAGTELALINYGTGFKKVAVSEFGGGGSSEEIWNTSRYANWRILKAEALGGNQAAITFTNSLGFINTGTATIKTSTYTAGNFIDTIRRIGLTSAATAGSVSQRRITSGFPCSMKSGFYFCADTISEDAATVATSADFVGLGTGFVSAFGNAEPSITTACVLLAYDSTDTNMQIMHNDNGGTCTKIDLGVNFPARTNATDLYRLELFCATNGVEINYRVTRLNTGQQVSGTLTTNIPTSASPLTLGFWRGNRTTALAVTKSFSQITIATPY